VWLLSLKKISRLGNKRGPGNLPLRFFSITFRAVFEQSRPPVLKQYRLEMDGNEEQYRYS
jgi:hypothetical protein